MELCSCQIPSGPVTSRSREHQMIGLVKHTPTKVQISVSLPKYNQRTLTKVQISVSSSKYIQRTLTKVQICVSSTKLNNGRLARNQSHENTQTNKEHHSKDTTILFRSSIWTSLAFRMFNWVTSIIFLVVLFMIRSLGDCKTIWGKLYGPFRVCGRGW